MPRRKRVTPPGFAYHVLNRGVRRATLFDSEADYDAFLGLLWKALQRVPIRLLAFCAMPNHWHMVVWPSDGQQLRVFMHWLTTVHAMRWHQAHGTEGTGPVYQDRYKSIPIETDKHLLTALRYVERNPLRAGLVARAEEWRWSSLCQPDTLRGALLTESPVPRPSNWLEIVNSE